MSGFELRWVKCHANEVVAVSEQWPMKLQYRTCDDDDWSEWIDVPMGDSE